jgi:hypothetical protein
MNPWDNFKDEELTPEERQRARWAAALLDRAFFFLKPLIAAKESWKAWVLAVVIVLWINRPEILAALSTLLGGR